MTLHLLTEYTYMCVCMYIKYTIYYYYTYILFTLFVSLRDRTDLAMFCRECIHILQQTTMIEMEGKIWKITISTHTFTSWNRIVWDMSRGGFSRPMGRFKSFFSFTKCSQIKWILLYRCVTLKVTYLVVQFIIRINRELNNIYDPSIESQSIFRYLRRIHVQY